MTKIRKDEHCDCLCCTLWFALEAWHRHHGHMAMDGRPIFNVPTTIDAVASMLGEILAGARRKEPARAAELEKMLQEAIAQKIAHYERLMAERLDGGGGRVH